MANATAARTVLPTPYPSLAYIAGAKSGKPNPAIERRKETAASAVRSGSRHARRKSSLSVQHLDSAVREGGRREDAD